MATSIMSCTCLVDFRQRDAVRPQLVGVDVDLILLDEAAGAGHLGDSLDGLQLVADIPVLKRPQLTGIGAGSFQRIPVNLPQGRGIRPEHRHDARRQLRRGDVHPLQHPRAGPVVIDFVAEDHENHREAEARSRANRLDPRRTLQGDGQRIGDLIFDVLRRPAGPVGKDDHLLLTNVRDGIDRRIGQAVPAHARRDGGEEEHQKMVVQAPADDGADHGRASSV